MQAGPCRIAAVSWGPATTLLHYRLAEKIGEGGMGQVWRATDTTLGREVAIKILPAEVAGDRERIARFEREARVLAALNHPGIAGIHGLHEAGGPSTSTNASAAGPGTAHSGSARLAWRRTSPRRRRRSAAPGPDHRRDRG